MESVRWEHEYGSHDTDRSAGPGAACGTARISAERAVVKEDQAISSAFPLKPQLQSGIAPAAFGIFGHNSDGFLFADDDQQFSGPGDGGIENAAAEQVGRTVPGGKNYGPVL